MLRKLISFSVDQPLVMTALTLLFIGFGLYAFKWLPVEAFPDVDDPQVQILTQRPGAIRRGNRLANYASMRDGAE
jgi:heavy metal efflux system protein